MLEGPDWESSGMPRQDCGKLRALWKRLPAKRRASHSYRVASKPGATEAKRSSLLRPKPHVRSGKFVAVLPEGKIVVHAGKPETCWQATVAIQDPRRTGWAQTTPHPRIGSAGWRIGVANVTIAPFVCQSCAGDGNRLQAAWPDSTFGLFEGRRQGCMLRAEGKGKSGQLRRWLRWPFSFAGTAYGTLQHPARDSSALKTCLEESRSPTPKANRPTGVQSG